MKIVCNNMNNSELKPNYYRKFNRFVIHAFKR